MERYAKIITNDSRFKRMLTLELEDIGIIIEEDLGFIKKDTDNACYIIADLDFCFEEDMAEFKNDVTVVGFSRLYENEISEKAVHCTHFLHRPFHIADLHSIFMPTHETHQKTRAIKQKKPNLQLDLKKRNYLTVDHTEKCAVLGENRVTLSENEYKILALLCENRGEAVNREALSSVIGATDSNMCDVYICFLRRKLDNKFGMKLIYTVRGQGYLLK